MKIYFDGASTKQLEEVLSLGIISGVTTNLSFCKKQMDITGQDYINLLQEIRKKISDYKKKKLSYSVQVSSDRPADIVNEALKLNELLSDKTNLKIKIPLSYENFLNSRKIWYFLWNFTFAMKFYHLNIATRDSNTR